MPSSVPNLITASVLAAHPYAPVLVLILGMIGFVAVVMALTHLIGPSRHGTVKGDAYESGMPVIGDARRRFRVRFYLVAMLFLLFDVEIVFLWPWAKMLAAARGAEAQNLAPPVHDAGHLLVAMALFFGILTVGFVYDWARGVFHWT